MVFIATFHSHYGAMAFKKALTERDIKVKLMPVPRYLSSSCGTCAKFQAEEGFVAPETPELDALYTEKGALIMQRNVTI